MLKRGFSASCRPAHHRVHLVQAVEHLHRLFEDRLPASVSASGRLPRSISATPNSSSSCWICRLSGGWAMCSFSAARVKFRSRATATK